MQTKHTHINTCLVIGNFRIRSENNVKLQPGSVAGVLAAPHAYHKTYSYCDFMAVFMGTDVKGQPNCLVPLQAALVLQDKQTLFLYLVSLNIYL